MERPDWTEIMKDCGGASSSDNKFTLVTVGTLRLAHSALRSQNEREAYHNYMAAELEIRRILEGKK